MPTPYAIDPATSPYCRAAYDVSQESYGHNVAIDSLTDRSGNGLTISSTSTARPLCLTNALNGLRVASFDGVDDLLAAATAGNWTFLHDGHPFTILAVVRQTVGVNPNRFETLCATSSASSPDTGFVVAYLDSAVNNSLHISMAKGVESFPILATTIGEILRPPSWHILGVRFCDNVRSLEDASAGNDLVVYVDGIPVGGQKVTNLPHATGAPLMPLNIGSRGTGTLAQIDLAWIGFFAGGLPKNLFYGYMEYLARRYGLGLTYAVNDGYAHCAFPGLAQLSDGTLLAGYSNKSYHNPEPKGPLVVKRSGDGGRTWGVERKVVSHATEGYSAVNLLINRFTGTVLLNTFRSDLTTPDAEVFRSTDQGLTWGSAISMNTGFTTWSATDGVGCILSNGHLLLPVYGLNTTQTFTSTKCVKSTDDGVTWGSAVTIKDGQAVSTSYNECSIVNISGTYPNETLLALIREETTLKIVKSTSTDSGATWGAVADVKTGTWGRPFAFKAASGKLYLLARSTTGNERGVLYWSADNGATWSTNPYVLDAINGYNGYAAALEIAPGKFFIVLASEMGPGVASDQPSQAWVRGMIHDEANINLLT